MGLLIIFALVYIEVAKKFNIVDNPNHRSSHFEPTIRGAGILFYLAALLFFIVSGFDFFWFFLGLTIVAVVSYIDDLISLDFKTRLIFQLIAISLVAYQLNQKASLDWIYLPILVLVGIGFINIYNFMDGINGITGMYSLVAFFGLYIINHFEAIIDERFLLYIMASVLVFGFFNFRKKARFFCGDVGSISLAVLLFFLILLFTFKLESPLIPLITIIYLADGILTIVYRKYLKENITEAHRHHIYQKLTDTKGFPHIKTSILYACAQGLIMVIIVMGYKQDMFTQLLMFVGISFFCTILYIILFRWLSVN